MQIIAQLPTQYVQSTPHKLNVKLFETTHSAKIFIQEHHVPKWKQHVQEQVRRPKGQKLQRSLEIILVYGLGIQSVTNWIINIVSFHTRQ